MAYLISPRDRRESNAIARAFAIIIAHAHGQYVRPRKLSTALARIQKWAKKTATELLRRWHISDVHTEVNDAIGQAYLQLCPIIASGHCDNRRSIVGLAYTILRRCCIDIVRRKVRSPFRGQVTDVGCEYTTWLNAIEHTELLQALHDSIHLLPAKQRAAVEMWIEHKQENRPLRFDSIELQRAFHNRMFHARRRLKELVRQRFDEVETEINNRVP